jgi:RNA polymerase sigma-70 factor (ECF subfamily)
MRYLRDVDASSQPGELLLPLPSVQESTATVGQATVLSGVSAALVQELWLTAEAEACGLSVDDFAIALGGVGAKLNHGQPSGVHPDPTQKAAFFRSLHLAEFALAQACALGRETAWERFLARYRAPLTQCAVSITGSATLGHDLADSLYSELYGLGKSNGERRSPLSSYSGRGSLLGWLRTTLAQRHVDHHRRTRRESPIDELDPAAPEGTPATDGAALERLTSALTRTLRPLSGEERFLLSAYFLDRQTLLQIARLLQVHEATISRRVKRLTADLHKQLLHNLQSGGLNKRAAEEALGADPRDVEINLRNLLQSSQIDTFSDKTASATPAVPDVP